MSMDTNKITKSSLRGNVRHFRRQEKLERRDEAKRIFSRIKDEANRASRCGNRSIVIDPSYWTKDEQICSYLKKDVLRLCRKLGKVQKFKYSKEDKSMSYRLRWKRGW